MYQSILIAYNGTAESRSALHECVRLSPSPSAKIHLLGVINPVDPILTGEYGAAAAYSHEELNAVEKTKMEGELVAGRQLLLEAKLNVEIHLESGEPADVISQMATRVGADLVIVGHPRHKSWMQRWWRGSTDALLLEKVHCTLMIAPGISKSAMASA